LLLVLLELPDDRIPEVLHFLRQERECHGD
jgi:hypothetical protein